MTPPGSSFQHALARFPECCGASCCFLAAFSQVVRGCVSHCSEQRQECMLCAFNTKFAGTGLKQDLVTKVWEFGPRPSSPLKPACGYGSKTKPPGDRRFWSTFPFTRIPFWLHMFDAQPCDPRSILNFAGGVVLPVCISSAPK